MALYQFLADREMEQLFCWPWPLNGDHRVYFLPAQNPAYVRCIGDFLDHSYISHWPVKVPPSVYFDAVLRSTGPQENNAAPWDITAGQILDPLQELSTHGANLNESLHEKPSLSKGGASPWDNFHPEPVTRRCVYSKDCSYGEFCANFEHIIPGAPSYCFKAARPYRRA